MRIDIDQNQFYLLHQKAVFWKEKATLLIGDLHLGKITYFREAGIAAPSSAYENNFARLSELMVENNPVRIIFLGDLFHNRYNLEWERFVKWRKDHPRVEIKMILGNHDILPRYLFEENEIEVYNEYREEKFQFVHQPVQSEVDYFSFCGHIHPVYCLRSPAKQSIKLPCFVVDVNQMILPSFGIFTGGFEMESFNTRRIFVIAEDKVLPV